MWVRTLILALMPVLFLTKAPAAAQEAKILAIGDSLMAWHMMTGQSISHVVGEELGEPTTNRAISMARVVFKLPLFSQAGMQISNQYTKGDWDWVILNGGGNDLWFGCGCKACDRKIEQLISKDGSSGAIPELIQQATTGGAKVVYIGYLRSPGVDSLIDECRDIGTEMEGRIADYADATKDVYFLSLEGMVPHGDRSYHGIDMIHPSLKASREIGQRIAEVIRKNDPNR